MNGTGGQGLFCLQWRFCCYLQEISLSTLLHQIPAEGVLAAKAEISSRLSSTNCCCIVQVHVLGDYEPRHTRRNLLGGGIVRKLKEGVEENELVF